MDFSEFRATRLKEYSLRTVVGLAVAALMAAATAVAFAHRTPPPMAPKHLGIHTTHFNTLTQAGPRLLAGGALGSILYSDDAGQHWQRAHVSEERDALLVQMAFSPDQKQGFAVGHEGWILRTDDGGSNWQEVRFDTEYGDPLMSIARLPSGDWITVGSFGQALRSSDQGKTWARMELPAEVEDKHLNRIVGSDDGQHWLIVGERGLVLHSHDAGESWQATEPFYNGSLYNAMALPQGGWLVYGMRGNIFVQPQAHAAWQPSRMDAPISFFGHLRDGDGRIVLAGQDGVLGISTDGGKTFALQQTTLRGVLTDVLRLSPEHAWISSTTGLQPLPALQ